MGTNFQRFCIQALFMAAASLVAGISNAIAQDACFVQLCTGVEPVYMYDNTSDGVPVAVCQTDTSAPSGIAHSLVSCPPGATLIPQSGMCHVDTCDGGGGGCSFRGVCGNYPGFPHYVYDGSGPGGLTPTCEADPTGLNYRAHVVASCLPGYSLVPGTGVCRQCAGNSKRLKTVKEIERGGGFPAVIFLPDLVIRATWLHTNASITRVSTLHNGTAYFACFIVANIGSAPSGAFRVQGGGLGVSVAPYLDQPGLAPNTSGGGCIYYPNTPPPGSYSSTITADSLNAVAESHEDNNEAVIRVIVVP